MLDRYQEYRLDNGLVVVLKNTPTETIAAKLRVHYGPIDEKAGEEGVAHFLEHCIAGGGSEKYNLKAADEVTGLFGYYNAFTDEGKTWFEANMLKEYLETWMDFISSHMFKPKLDKKRFNEERERVLREIADLKSDPSFSIHRELDSKFYRGHPKGVFIAGKEEIIKNMDMKGLMDFYSRGYYPNNMDLIIAGGLPKNIERQVENYFGCAPPGKNTRKKFPEIKPLNGKNILHTSAPELLNVDFPDETSSVISLSCLAPKIDHDDRYSFEIMNQLLGGTSGSLLHKKVSLEKGLAYSVNTMYEASYNVGELDLAMLVPAKKIDESIDAVFGEIRKIKTGTADKKDIENVKRAVKYEIVRLIESNSGNIMIIEEKLDNGLTPESLIDGFNKVDQREIMEIANKYLPDRENGNYVLGIRDPLKK